VAEVKIHHCDTEGTEKALKTVERPADPVLSEIVARLVSAIDPEKLILFGSRTKGTGGPDNDYDILIVKGEPDPARRRTGPLYRKLWGIPNAVDLLWYTPQEVEEWAEVRQHVATQAVGHGVVVYEKAR
jgi:predicted nucleotidyltransferase